MMLFSIWSRITYFIRVYIYIYAHVYVNSCNSNEMIKLAFAWAHNSRERRHMRWLIFLSFLTINYTCAGSFQYIHVYYHKTFLHITCFLVAINDRSDFFIGDITAPEYSWYTWVLSLNIDVKHSFHIFIKIVVFQNSFWKHFCSYGLFQRFFPISLIHKGNKWIYDKEKCLFEKKKKKCFVSF